MTFSGNCPRTVSTLGKYHLRRVQGRWRVQLDYVVEGDVIRSNALGHQTLIDLIIRGRRQSGGGASGGAFYINEYGQVLLPGRQGSPYSVAGEYHDLLEFNVEGVIISACGVGRPPRLPLAGDPWPGPRHGIPYGLRYMSGTWDIDYWRQLANGDMEVVRLSSYCTPQRVNELGRLIRSVKNHAGRFYLNEQRQMFGPRRTDDEGWEMVYVGELDLTAGWFPKPLTGS